MQAPPDVSLWHYSYAARPTEEENDYREHFLDNDLKQVTSSFYAITVLLIAMILVDVSRLADQPGLITGLLIKVLFMFSGLGMAWIAVKVRTPKVLDRGVLIYTTLFAVGILITHVSAEYSAVRMTALAVVFIYTGHFAFPVYATRLLPAMGLLILGECAILVTTTRQDLIQDTPVILIVIYFAEIMSVLASALHHRMRYGTFFASRQVKTLSGFLPICANCKSVRKDEGYYQQIDQFISENSDTKFSHGICPKCAEELYGDIGAKLSMRTETQD